MWPVYRRLLQFVKPHLPQLALAFVFMVLLSVTTMMYAFLSGPLVAAVITGGQSGLDSFTRIFPFLEATFARLDTGAMTQVVPWLLAGVAAVKGIAFLGQHYFVRTVGQAVIVDLRNALFAKVLRLPMSYFDGAASGDLMSRFSSDVTQVETSVTEALADLIRNGLMVVGLVAQCFLLDVQLAAIAFFIVPFTGWPIAKFTKYLRQKARQGQDSLGEAGAQIAETLNGMRIVQAFGREDAEMERFEAESAHYLHIMKRAILARGLYSPIMEVAGVVGFAMLLVYASGRIAAGELKPEFLMSFLATVLMVYQPVKQLGRVSNQIFVGVAAAERIFEVLDAEEPLVDRPEAAPATPVRDAIAFENLSFAYDDRGLALDGVDIRVPHGDVVALVGPSGAGKSTLATLLPRFVDPSAGRITCDGVDIRDLTLASWRAQLSVVTQETVLFSGSVRDNIAYARPDATDDEVRAAAEAAYCTGFIDALPEGMDAKIGERGVRLSGGQRQRLSIARAILADAPILVLDEATSALDSESEKQVQSALENLMRGRTTLVIAHRLSTIRHADAIVVLDGGKVVERGTHAQLLEQGGVYARLSALQSAHA